METNAHNQQAGGIAAILLELLLASVTAYFLCLRIEPVETQAVLAESQPWLYYQYVESWFPVLLNKLRYIGGGFSPLTTFVGAFLFFVFHQTRKQKKLRFIVSAALVSLLFGVAQVLGMSMHSLGNLDFLFASLFQTMLAACVILSWSLCMYVGCLWLFGALDTLAEDSAVLGSIPRVGRFSRVRAFASRHPQLACFLLLFACYLPWLVIYYPGCATWDTFLALESAFSIVAPNNHHPIYYSWLLGGFIQFGRALFGSDNLGLFLFVLMQTGLCAWAYAMLLSAMRELGAKRSFRIVCLLFFALTPIWGAYAVLCDKDSLFAAFSVMFAVWTMRYVFDLPSARTTAVAPLRYMLCALAMCLCRNNGIYTVALTGAGLGVLFLAGVQKKRTVKPLRHAFFALILSVAAAFVLTKAMLPVLGVQPGSKREMLSIPFQQTARYVKEYPNDVTDAERTAIDAVLQYDTLATGYRANVSDDVKDTYRLHGAPDESALLRQYMRVWLQMFFKHPRVYAEATLGNSYGYYAFTQKAFYIGQNQGMSFRLHIEKWVDPQTPFALESPKALYDAQSAANQAVLLFGSLPPLNLLYTCAFYTWLLLGCAGYLFHKRAYRGLVGLLIPLSILLVCIASPVNDCFRYFIVIAATTPLTLTAAARLPDPQSTRAFTEPSANG